MGLMLSPSECLAAHPKGGGISRASGKHLGIELQHGAAVTSLCGTGYSIMLPRLGCPEHVSCPTQ